MLVLTLYCYPYLIRLSKADTVVLVLYGSVGVICWGSRYTLWSCQNVCDALSYLLDNIYIRFGTKLYRQIVGIPMGTNCAPLVADLFLYCHERDFMDSLNHDNQADVIEAFNSTSRYLDDFLNIDNPYFDGMVNQIYPSELQLNKANISDTEAPFLDLHLSVANGFVSSKMISAMTLILK